MDLVIELALNGTWESSSEDPGTDTRPSCVEAYRTIDADPESGQPLPTHVRVLVNDNPPEVKMTVDEAERFARRLLDLVATVRAEDGRGTV